MQDNPILVEQTRGPLVESRHRGAFVIVDAAGGVVAAAGDIERARKVMRQHMEEAERYMLERAAIRQRE